MGLPANLGLPADIGSAELLTAMRDHPRVKLGQWFISVDEHGAWLTNPYGLDCALFTLDEQGAQRLLGYVAAGDQIPHEWGRL